MKVFVTGCDGFVGSHIAERLADEGHEVVAGCYVAPLFISERKQTSIRRFDLCLPETIRPCLEGVECIVHCAAIFDLAATVEQLHAVNVQGTANLLQAAKAAGVRQFIHFSTAEVYGAPQFTPLTEDHPLHPGTPYGQSKLESERLVQAESVNGRMDTIIIRPSGIYGPRCVYAAGIFVPLIVLKEMGIKKLPVLYGDLKFNCVHVDDIALFVAYAIKSGKDWNSIYNLADNDIVTLEPAVRAFYQIFGFQAGFRLLYPKRGLRCLWYVGPCLMALGAFQPLALFLNWYWGRICRKYQLKQVLRFPKLDRCMLHIFRVDKHFCFDNQRVLATGFKFQNQSFIKAFDSWLAWYREQHWIPDYSEA
ncbi:MAG: NAD(P)-dependent oxidoreductase [Kiritimatiellae bacterium]|nr:NAD(P)-dependent oxidoreductase [Verrucomicrobiota bacterium]MCG2658711.1 NAD(P)-dependent oxidoreductase [Kiritimatiellia bacterium]